MATTVTAAAQPNNVPPRVQLSVSTNTSGKTSSSLLRVAADGSTERVRTTDGLAVPLSGGSGTAFDYDAPFGLPVSYRDADEGSASAPVTLAVAVPWLLHPGKPQLSMPVSVAEFGDRTYEATRTLLQPLGRSTAIPITDGARKAPSGTIQFRTRTLAELTAFTALLADQSALLFNVPPALGWGVATGWVSIGQVTEERIVTPFAGRPDRYLNLPADAVSLPTGGVVAQRSFADVLAQFADFDSLTNGYASFDQVVTG